MSVWVGIHRESGGGREGCFPDQRFTERKTTWKCWLAPPCTAYMAESARMRCFDRNHCTQAYVKTTSRKLIMVFHHCYYLLLHPRKKEKKFAPGSFSHHASTLKSFWLMSCAQVAVIYLFIVCVCVCVCCWFLFTAGCKTNYSRRIIKWPWPCQECWWEAGLGYLTKVSYKVFTCLCQRSCAGEQ